MTSEEIRQAVIALGHPSWTTPQWQEDILAFIRAHREEGSCVVELGCALGGNTCQFANLCAELELTLYVVDTSPVYIEKTKDALRHFGYFGIKERVIFCECDIQTFAAGNPDLDIILVVHDSDHEFMLPVQDIGALYKFNRLPRGIIFHDFCMRRFNVQNPNDPHIYCTAIDKAIQYCMGDGVKPQPVGELFIEGHYNTIHNPNPAGIYYAYPFSEGACISPIPEPQYVYGATFEEYKDILTKHGFLKEEAC